MATALVTQIAYAVQTLFDPAGTAGRLVDLGKLANYGLLTNFTPGYLFTPGVNGAWYDPSDFSTLFQDAAGTTPVTAVGQPVGLMLDKSKGLVLGPELVTNGTFDSGTGWTLDSGATISGGALNFSSVAIASGAANIGNVTAGKWYKISYSVISFTSGGVSFSNGVDVTTGVNAVGAYSQYLYVTTSGPIKIVARFSSATLSIDNISVRELPGNHAYNPSGNSANFPVLSARYNLLTKTEQFDDAVWTKANASVTSDTAVSPSGTLTADKLVESAATGGHVIRQSGTASTVPASITIYAKAGERQYLQLGAGVTSQQYANFDLVNGSIAAVGSDATATMVGVGNGWYRCYIDVGSISSGTALVIGVVNSSSAAWQQSYTGNGTSGIYIWGADLRVSNDALNQPAYQRVNTASDYDTAGFKPYLSFNGVNQWLQTNSIDFTYGDKMFVSAGVRKLSDVVGCITETSSDASVNGGAFYVINRGVSSNDYLIGLRGTSFVYDQFFVAPPTTSVIAFSTDIGQVSRADELKTRLDGAAASVTRAGATAGTGNYGNYPLYIGARAGNSLWFNGRLYGMVVAGKQASAAEITSTETYINQRTGAF